MKRFFVALATFLAAATHAAGPPSPEEAVSAFYNQEIHGPFAKDDRLLGAMRHRVTSELDALLTATDNYQQACTKRVPRGVKPWIIDGDPWYYHSSDGARYIDGTELVALGESTAIVAAHLRYDDQMRWTDNVTLVKIGTGWKIANIKFEQGGGLIQSLHDYIKAPCFRM